MFVLNFRIIKWGNKTYIESQNSHKVRRKEEVRRKEDERGKKRQNEGMKMKT